MVVFDIVRLSFGGPKEAAPMGKATFSYNYTNPNNVFF